jgi:hypothetical protein
MTTLQAEPKQIAKKKHIGIVPHIPDPVAKVEAIITEERAQRPTKPTRPMSYSTIAELVCETFGVSVEDCASTTRHKRVVLAREVTIVLAREFTLLSFPEIARKMSRPNHSTVITAYQRYEKTREQAVVWGHINFSKAEWVNLIRSQLLDRLDPKPM